MIGQSQRRYLNSTLPGMPWIGSNPKTRASKAETVVIATSRKNTKRWPCRHIERKAGSRVDFATRHARDTFKAGFEEGWLAGWLVLFQRRARWPRHGDSRCSGSNSLIAAQEEVGDGQETCDDWGRG
jgi:hypothetical protein